MMKLLYEITEKNLGMKDPEEILGYKYEFIKSARGIVLNDKDEVCLQYVSKRGYYKLPGGGVERGETEKEALMREVLEEVGCKVKIERELGITLEFRNKTNLLHVSYGYTARVDGEVGEPAYEQGEIDDGFKPVWVSIDKALELINPDAPLENYKGRFIVKREHIFLTEAKKLLLNT